MVAATEARAATTLKQRAPFTCRAETHQHTWNNLPSYENHLGSIQERIDINFILILWLTFRTKCPSLLWTWWMPELQVFNAAMMSYWPDSSSMTSQQPPSEIQLRCTTRNHKSDTDTLLADHWLAGSIFTPPEDLTLISDLLLLLISVCFCCCLLLLWIHRFFSSLLFLISLIKPLKYFSKTQ